MVRRRRKINWIVASILAICLIVAVGVCVSFYQSLGFDFMAFDSATWKASPPDALSHDSIRLRMVDDFLKSHHPVGKSRAEIVALLGEPDITGYFHNYDMVYLLGLERRYPVAIDSEWLVLRLNSANIVIEARLTTD